VQVVDKQFGNFLKQYATSDYWRKYHHIVSGEWSFAEKPMFDVGISLLRPVIINGKNFDGLVCGTIPILDNFTLIFGYRGEDFEDPNTEVQVFYSSLTGW
jgi:hypothetical protein